MGAQGKYRPRTSSLPRCTGDRKTFKVDFLVLGGATIRSSCVVLQHSSPIADRVRSATRAADSRRLAVPCVRSGGAFVVSKVAGVLATDTHVPVDSASSWAEHK